MKLFKCLKCGNIMELVEGNNPHIMCCDEQMKELKPNTSDASGEKHLPACHIEDDVVIVSIGETAHPMEEKHYIEYIVAEYKDSVMKYKLAPNQNPEACLDYEPGMKIYAYCNLHGLWVKEL